MSAQNHLFKNEAIEEEIINSKDQLDKEKVLYEDKNPKSSFTKETTSLHRQSTFQMKWLDKNEYKEFRFWIAKVKEDITNLNVLLAIKYYNWKLKKA